MEKLTLQLPSLALCSGWCSGDAPTTYFMPINKNFARGSCPQCPTHRKKLPLCQEILRFYCGAAEVLQRFTSDFSAQWSQLLTARDTFRGPWMGRGILGDITSTTPFSSFHQSISALICSVYLLGFFMMFPSKRVINKNNFENQCSIVLKRIDFLAQ